MKHIKTFEKYNDNLNTNIKKYFNEHSEEIIKLVDNYKKLSDAKNILEKISFIIESPGDVKTIEKDNIEIVYFISLKDDNKPTIFFNIEEEKFYIKSYNENKKSLI